MTAYDRLRSMVSRVHHLAPRQVVLAGLAAASLLTLAGSGPWSPLALDRVDSALAHGRPEAALRICERIARFSPFPGHRAEARYREALLLVSQAGEPVRAAELLLGLLRDAPTDPVLEGAALVLLGQTLERLGEDRRAAVAYERRLSLGGEPEAWLLAAAQAWERAGEPRLALLRFGRVAARGGPEAPRARLAMGRVFLGTGQAARAYGQFAAALHGAQTPEEARLARLGRAMALDALGEADQAVAELDEVDLEVDPALGITRDRVARRAEVSGLP